MAGQVVVPAGGPAARVSNLPLEPASAIDLTRTAMAMSTRNRLLGSAWWWFAASVALLSLAGCAPERPNLLLIAVDTLRADHLGAYGYERPTSPSIDALFDSSVVFDDVTSSSPWTLPSFATMMTSLQPSAHRVWNFKSRLDDSYTTLAEILRDAGFDTGAVVSHVFLGDRFGLHQGFEDYDQSLVLRLGASHNAISSPAITEKAQAWLRDRASLGKSDPWFLWLHYFDPHSVYHSHEGFTEPFGIRKVDLYDGEIAFTDAHIGRLLATLGELDLDANTVVVFVADHGEEFRDHGRGGHGATLFQEAIRLPLAIRAPGFEPRRVADAVRAIDLLPTILEILEVAPPDTPVMGRSVVAAMRGKAMEERGMQSEVTRKSHLSGWSFRSGRWKMIERARRHGRNRVLFDLQADPAEKVDVASEHPRIVETLAADLEATLRLGREIAMEFTDAEDLELSQAEIDRLRSLGYVE